MAQLFGGFGDKDEFQIGNLKFQRLRQRRAEAFHRPSAGLGICDRGAEDAEKLQRLAETIRRGAPTRDVGVVSGRRG